MLYIIVHLYVVKNAEEKMYAYEKKALNVFRKHGGEVVTAFRPKSTNANETMPDEIQILRIESQKSFDTFMQDRERLTMAAERDAAIRKTEVFISGELVEY